MSERDPTRLFDDPSADEALRAGLDAAQHDLPSEAELASLAARLGPLLVPPGGGGAADPSPVAGGGASGLAAKTIAVLAAAAAVSGVVWWGASGSERAPRPRAEPVIVPVEPAPPTEELPAGLDVPEELVTDEAPPRSRPPPAPRLETDPEAELALIREAQDALRASPARALSLTDAHRRRFGDGTLAQEREVVAIDALVRLGRRDEARARAAALHRRWPRSAHGRRVDVLVGGAE